MSTWIQLEIAPTWTPSVLAGVEASYTPKEERDTASPYLLRRDKGRVRCNPDRTMSCPYQKAKNLFTESPLLRRFESEPTYGQKDCTDKLHTGFFLEPQPPRRDSLRAFTLGSFSRLLLSRKQTLGSQSLSVFPRLD